MPRESPEQEPPLVFVCYSRKDGEHVERLRTVLRPFENRKQLRLWYDLEIAPGTEADAKIQNVIQKADIALLVVSTDMLGSAYVEQRELPPILTAGKQGKLKVVPLFLRDTLVRDQRLTFTTGDGTEPFLLTTWQGLNQPNEYLVVDGDLDEARLNAAAAKLLGVATAVAAERTRKPSRRATPPANQDRPEVTLQLTPEGGTLHRRFLGPYGELLSLSSPCRPLQRGGGSPWHPDELFEALFGNQETCTSLLKQLFPKAKRPTPVSYGGARVRIAADDPRLLAQPWNTARWTSHRLVDANWTFEFASQADATRAVAYRDLRVDLPCTILIAAPEATRLQSKTHAESMREIAQQASRTLRQPDVVARWDHLREALRGRPTILHLHCAGEIRGGEPHFRFEAPGGASDLRTARELAGAFATTPPRVLLLNVLDGSDLDWTRAIGELARHVPLVVAQHAHLHQGDTPEDDPRLAAQRILHHILVDEAPDPIRSALEHGIASVNCWSQIGGFSRSHSAPPQPRSPRVVLDRSPQRDAAEGQCNNLLASPELRCALLLSYGTAGNQLDHLGKQIESRLNQRKIGVRRMPIALARTGESGAVALDRALAAALQVPSGKTWVQVLEQQLSKWFKTNTTGLVLLDFGVHGGNSPDHGPALTDPQVEAIAQYCRDELAPRCPKRARLACVLTLQVDETGLNTTESLLDRLHDELPTSTYRIALLGQVKRVKRADIFDYLTASENHSGCNPKLADAWATALHKRTAGHFEQTVALIESQEVGWSQSFLESLQHPAAPPAANQSDAPAP